MTRKLDLVGSVFGRLTVIEEKKPVECPPRWICRCTCGVVKDYARTVLRRGSTKSCGCLNQENRLVSSVTHGATKEGSVDNLYTRWLAMKSRCYYPKNIGYKYYGGRGISVCREWESSYENFSLWAKSSGYKKGLILDRIDCDGDYTPVNCRWVNAVESANNCRRNRIVLLGGVQMTVAEAARSYEVAYSVLHDRLRLGWSIEDAVSVPKFARAKK